MLATVDLLLPYRVDFGPEHLFIDQRPYRGDYLVGPEMYQWLISHVGPGKKHGLWTKDCAWAWTHTWQGGSIQGPTYNAIHFSDPQIAMLFKLTWA